MAKRFRSCLPFVLAGLLVGCPAPMGKLPATQPTARATARPTPAIKPPTGTDLMQPGTGLIGNDGGGLIGNDGGGLIGNDGGGLIGQDGAGLIGQDGAGLIGQDGAGISGVARLPAGIMSRDGAGLVAQGGGNLIGQDGAGLIGQDGAGLIGQDGAGFRLAALPAAQPIRRQLVYLMNAEDQLVTGADGKPLTAMTDDQGRFSFKGFINTRNLILAIKLFDDRGLVKALLPRGDAPSRTAALDLVSTLATTYIEEQYLKPQADRVQVLERLTAELEAATREVLAGVAERQGKLPAVLAAPEVVGLVNGLRASDQALDAQLAEVRRVLFAGLSDQGVGEPADTLETDAIDVAIAPTGEVVYAGSGSRRVWKKDKAGNLVPLAGTGFLPAIKIPGVGEAQGDGGPATAAPLDPFAVAYMPDGTLLIADKLNRRIRQVGADGVITTRVGSRDWEEPRDLLVEPDGGLVLATHSAIWRVPPGGSPTLIAGKPRAYTQGSLAQTKPAGDGGPATQAVFGEITAIARDGAGALYVHDINAGVRKIVDGQIGMVPGSEKAVNPDAGVLDLARSSIGGGVTVTADGRLIVAEAGEHLLREVAGGSARTIAGNGKPYLVGDGGPAAQAGLAVPARPFAAPDRRIYFVDDGYVRYLAPDDTIHTLVGGTRDFDKPRAPDKVQLFGPSGLAYDAASHAMLIADLRHLWRWDLAANTLVSVYGGGLAGKPFVEGQPARECGLAFPFGLSVEGPERWSFIVTDSESFMGRYLRVEDGKLVTLAGGGTTLGLADRDEPALGAQLFALYMDTALVDGWYYYSIGQLGRVRRFQPGGNTQAFAGYGSASSNGTPAKDFKFPQITVLTEGPDGLYLADYNTIYRIDPVTTHVTRVASDLNSPANLAWDAAGNLYFSEEYSGLVSRIRKGADRVDHVAGKGTSLLAGATVDTGLVEPSALAFDKNGDLYIADIFSGQIKVVRKAQLPN